MDDLTQDTDYDLMARLRDIVKMSALSGGFPLPPQTYDYLLQINAEVIRRQSRSVYLVSTNVPLDTESDPF